MYPLPIFENMLRTLGDKIPRRQCFVCKAITAYLYRESCPLYRLFYDGVAKMLAIREKDTPAPPREKCKCL